MATPMLDYSPPKRRTGFAVVLIYAAFLTALLYLFFSQAGDDAPLRARADFVSPLANVEAQLKLANEQDPAPAELLVYPMQQINGDYNDADQFTRVYYMAQYIRYPHRLLVGMDDTIINGPPQLMSVREPSIAWMLDHHVRQIYFLSEQMGPNLEVRPIQ